MLTRLTNLFFRDRSAGVSGEKPSGHVFERHKVEVAQASSGHYHFGDENAFSWRCKTIFYRITEIVMGGNFASSYHLQSICRSFNELVSKMAMTTQKEKQAYLVEDFLLKLNRLLRTYPNLKRADISNKLVELHRAQMNEEQRALFSKLINNINLPELETESSIELSKQVYTYLQRYLSSKGLEPVFYHVSANETKSLRIANIETALTHATAFLDEKFQGDVKTSAGLAEEKVLQMLYHINQPVKQEADVSDKENTSERDDIHTRKSEDHRTSGNKTVSKFESDTKADIQVFLQTNWMPMLIFKALTTIS